MSVLETIVPTRPDFAAIKRTQHGAWASGDYAIIGATLQIVGEEADGQLQPPGVPIVLRLRDAQLEGVSVGCGGQTEEKCGEEGEAKDHAKRSEAELTTNGHECTRIKFGIRQRMLRFRECPYTIKFSMLYPAKKKRYCLFVFIRGSSLCFLCRCAFV